MDRGAWQVAFHRVAQSWTWLKQRSMHTEKQNIWQRRRVARSIMCSGAYLCPALCSLCDCSLAGSSVHEEEVLHGIFQARNSGVGCHFLFKGIVQTQGSNLVSLVCPALQMDSLLLGHWGNHVAQKACIIYFLLCYRKFLPSPIF